MVNMVAPVHSRHLLADDDDGGDDYDYDYEEDTDEESPARGTRITWMYLPFIACEDRTDRKIDTFSATRCQDECEDDDDCLSFSYNTVEGRCFTKRTECVEQTQNPDNFSAIKRFTG